MQIQIFFGASGSLLSFLPANPEIITYTCLALPDIVYHRCYSYFVIHYTSKKAGYKKDLNIKEIQLTLDFLEKK
jgi:hypothetical protein